MQDMNRKVVNTQAIADGSIYRVEPVDIMTFVGSKEYLGLDTYNPPLSGEQHEFMSAMSDFENGKTFAVLWVGR